MVDYIYSIFLSIALIIDLYMIFYLNKKLKKNRYYKIMTAVYVILIFYFIGLILQLIFKQRNVPLIYFDYITYIGATLLPVVILFMALMYLNKNIKINKLWLLFVIPVVSLLTIFTNDMHHLFYIKYSVQINESVYGPMFALHSAYSYILLILSMIILVYASIKKSGFFSKPTILIVIGSSVPLLINILGTLKIIPMSIYITPITFIFACICYSLAIIKYKALNIIPVALATVTDTMSDSFVVISDDGTIADTNLTFRKTFENIIDVNKDKNLFELIDEKGLLDINKLKEAIKATRKKDSIQNVEYHLEYGKKEKYFEVDIHPIKAKNDKTQYVGTLLLFKDITQHKKDIKEIEEKQDIIVKQGQLVSIGELAGGVAHDINTPISAIKTGVTMLSQNPSIDENAKEILTRMDNCATKIINIVNSMRNQIRNLGGTTKVKFKIKDVIEDIKVITYHEVCKNKSEFIVKIEDDLSVEGDPTKLGQVITNLVVNAAQAYGDKGGKIEVSVEKAPKSKALIKVSDYAGGLSEEIKPYIFKNILTTKGTFGTGLGLYLAYSVIKGEFNGKIDFQSEKGEGTTFYISIPTV